MLNKKLGELKKVIFYTLSIFLILSFVYLSIATVIMYNSNMVQKNEIAGSEERMVNVEKTIISNKINRLIADVLFISDSLKLVNISAENSVEIEKLWLAFSNRKEIYDQIRYIDINGDEIIRINYSNEGSYVVEPEILQNKKDRYYFTDTISLKENQIYISRLDLNIENFEIEQPIKPMIRLSVPHYGTDGKLKGIVILNYLANDMLEQVSKIASTSHGNIFMLNSNSFWVYNSDSRDKEWSFMYDEKISENFQSYYSDEWKIIKNTNEGTIKTEKGFFTYTTVLTGDGFSLADSNYTIVPGEGGWYIVSYIPSVSENGEFFSDNIIGITIHVIKNNIMILIFLFLLAVVLATLMNINKIKNDKIKYFSEYDTMTGVYNRRAGFEKLHEIYKKANKDNNITSICFIDINGLKEVNDNLGHEIGDELILSIIDGIKKNVRVTDFIARLGGDEFIIIFQNMNATGAEEIWQRIKEEYKIINETQNRKYIISASHGVEEFRFDSNEYIDSVINRADEKMYNEKRIIKKDLKVVRD